MRITPQKGIYLCSNDDYDQTLTTMIFSFDTILNFMITLYLAGYMTQFIYARPGTNLVCPWYALDMF